MGVHEERHHSFDAPGECRTGHRLRDCIKMHESRTLYVVTAIKPILPQAEVSALSNQLTYYRCSTFYLPCITFGTLVV